MFKGVVVACLATVCTFAAANGAWAQEASGRHTISVAPVELQGGAHLPQADATEVLKRDIETALEATGLFTVTQTNKAELQAVLAEMKRSGRPSAKAIRSQFLMTTDVASAELNERRRPAPGNRNQDLVEVTGSISLRVTVMQSADAKVKARMAMDVDYAAKPRLADPVGDGSYGRAQALNGPASSVDFIALSHVAASAVAKRVLDQMYPVVVVQRNGQQVFLSRGEDFGYKIGETLRVLRLGAELKDQRTGEVLDRSDTPIGEVRVTEVRPRVSVAQIVKSTAEIAAGDIVREQVDPDQ
jgi:hypothetical protein